MKLSDRETAPSALIGLANEKPHSRALSDYEMDDRATAAWLRGVEADKKRAQQASQPPQDTAKPPSQE